MNLPEIYVVAVSTTFKMSLILLSLIVEGGPLFTPYSFVSEFSTRGYTYTKCMFIYLLTVTDQQPRVIT